MIDIYLEIEPVAKARARHRSVKTKSGKSFVQSYTPKKTKDFESEVAQIAKYVMQAHKIIDGPCRLRVAAFFSIPESWPLWKQSAALQGRIAHTVKPDDDNVLKSVKDALNAIVYVDDSYVVDSQINKFYANKPALAISIKPLPLCPAQANNKSEFLKVFPVEEVE